jgi:hypothetical protein
MDSPRSVRIRSGERTSRSNIATSIDFSATGVSRNATIECVYASSAMVPRYTKASRSSAQERT